MPPSLRDAWAAVIQAADYDAHMAAIGQAQSNASLVAELFGIEAPPPEAAVLFAGAGTGQMFDYIHAELLRPYRTTFTDINPAFLDRLAARLEPHGLAFQTAIDDVERTNLPRAFELVIAVLVLEHVNWRCAVGSLSRLTTSRVYVVIQEDPPDLRDRPARGTMQVLREIQPQRIDREELAAAFSAHGLTRHRTSSREAADGKRMAAFEFRLLP